MPEVTDPALLQALNGHPAAPQPRQNTVPAFIPGQVPATRQAAEARAQTDQALQIDAARRAAAAEARAAEAADRARREWEATHNPDGTPKAKPSTGATDPTRIATLNSIVDQVNRVAQLYRSGIRDENLFNLFGLVDAVGPEAGRFNSAGQGLADQGLAAFRVPGVGAQSDLEAKQFAQANTPQAGNWDASIEEKLANIRRRVDANRAAVGLPPAKWESIEDQSRVDSTTMASLQGGSGAPPATPDQPQPPAIDPSGGPVPPIFGPGNAPMQAADGSARRVEDPEMAARLDALMRQGAPLEEINRVTVGAGFSPIKPDEYNAVRQFLRQNPGYQGSVSNAVRLEPLSAYEQIITNIGDNPAGAYFVGAGNYLSGNTLDNLSSDPERARAAMDVISSQNKTASALGEVSGGILGSVVGEAGLARAGLAPSFLRGLAPDVAMGAANGAGMADSGNRGMNALLGAGAAAAGNVVGSGFAGGVNALARGVTDPAVNAMQREIGPLTIGQTVGQSGRVGAAVKGVEDRLAGFPVVGDMINARRAEGYQRFNTQAFNKALEPIGGQVGDGLVGKDAVEDAANKVQQAFARALQGKAVAPDSAFANEMYQASVKSMSIPRVGSEVADNLRTILEPYMQGGQLSGEAMQTISRELRDLKGAYRAKEPALYKRIGSAIDSTENAIFGMFRRQAPEVLPAYNAAKAAYRRVSILADSVLKAKNQGDNVFTPAQLNASDAANAVKYEGRLNAAAGDRQFREYAEAGQQVLPNKVPDSGTAGRLLLGGIGTGATLGGAVGLGSGSPVEGAGAGAGTGLTMAAILAAAYSKAGQRVLTKAARGSQGPVGRKLTDPRLKQLLRKSGAASAVESLPETAPGR